MENKDNYFKYIENTIKHYLAEENTDYGIMLTGEWGAGKTYYVKNNYKDSIYVSVAGKNTIDDVIYDISISGIFDVPKKDSDCPNIKAINNVNKMALKIFKPIIKYTNNILEEPIMKILSDISNNSIEINKILLIIDDLERLSKNINIEDLLYSIYDNFISNNVKVLFICNEEVLINNGEYNKIKEKIIRHTIKLHSIDKNNFKLFLETYIIKNLIYDKDIENYYISNHFFYEQCIPNIINIFMEMECYNIRTFKKFFDMSKYFLNEINRFIEKEEYKLNNNEELFLEILKIFAIVLIVYDKNIINNSVFVSKE
ncbi:P-loop NTPase fold protein [uncultured Brachyspira sp.]|uniref:P-loop NTPase fold protein n=1 Tax=uncultured Brachyspira sp. TaxID=221953 RepID=UPI00262D98A8|nr:P-loop NTPase fold protein [uncultured Brachyspira sp.]